MSGEAVLAEGGHDLLGHLVADMLIKGGIVVGAAVLALLGAMLLWRRIGR
ncbi:MAG: hypothetical protein L0I76_04625 [Pseudonocardia sp.]|nr:hypothetical protein [Pseudonocardia sp.]